MVARWTGPLFCRARAFPTLAGLLRAPFVGAGLARMDNCSDTADASSLALALAVWFLLFPRQKWVLLEPFPVFLILVLLRALIADHLALFVCQP